MGKIFQINTEYPEQMGEELIYSNLTKEEKEALGKYRCEALKRLRRCIGIPENILERTEKG